MEVENNVSQPPSSPSQPLEDVPEPGDTQEVEQVKTRPDSEWTQHPTLYLPDGTVVLLAEGVLFRVYGGLLARHSEVFRSMFSLSSHLPSNAEQHDGCPLVRLKDTPKDLEYFLNVLLDGINYFVDCDQILQYPAMAAMLRLSTKYIVPTLRSRVIAHFERVIPTSFEKMVTPGPKTEFDKMFGSTALPGKPLTVDILELFRECGVEKLLPWAFHYVAGLAFASDGETEVLYVTNDEDRAVLDKALPRLHLMHFRHLGEIYGRNSDACLENHKCQQSTSTLLQTLMEDLCHPFDSRRVTQSVFSEWLRSIDQWKATCKVCSEHRAQKLQAAQKELWNALPEMFSLSPWEVLLKEEKVDT
ncbi:hypothetical protein K439DRAFT_1410929 [Ramaria rubella]|nr:hypothetical protein K439DRAFT_1410929 [Ramaria rubella]